MHKGFLKKNREVSVKSDLVALDAHPQDANSQGGEKILHGDFVFDAKRGKLDLAISAAWLYHHEGLTQIEIAQLLDTSRPTVANLLARAKAEGIVKISVRPDYLTALTLAKRFRQRFGLQDVLIVPVPADTDEGMINRSLGKAGALYLEERLQPGEVLATAWGAAMLEVALALDQKAVENVIIAQSLGGLSTSESFGPAKVASLMGDKFGARVHHLYVPAVVESREVRDILLRDRSIHAALEVARSATKAMLGIGKVADDATVVRGGFISAVQIDELRARKAVGDIAGRFFDVDGQPVRTEFDERIVGLSLEEVKAISPVIAVVGGIDKVHAVLGALRGGYLDVLIVDERTAQAVMSLAETG